eukprot:3883100-Rhodomonas_salina.2
MSRSMRMRMAGGHGCGHQSSEPSTRTRDPCSLPRPGPMMSIAVSFSQPCPSRCNCYGCPEL